MSHYVRVLHSPNRTLPWRADCRCGWASAADSETRARDAADEHAFTHRGSVQVLTGVAS